MESTSSIRFLRKNTCDKDKKPMYIWDHCNEDDDDSYKLNTQFKFEWIQLFSEIATLCQVIRPKKRNAQELW